MRIGNFALDGQVFLAPMSGVSDRPCREISVKYGAALATTEMLTSDRSLWHSEKSLTRIDFTHHPGLVSVQIAGTEPDQMASAAAALVERGAQIIDINLGCPAKKVCGAASGSALLKDLTKVRQIFQAVVAAVDAPVTVKTRTGWDAHHSTAVEVAQMAEAEGLQAFALHGRTRDQHYTGVAEHETLKRVRDVTSLPLIANGDINSPEIAKQVLASTGADAVMIGRSAQGNPWLIEGIDAALRGQPAREVTDNERWQVLSHHIALLGRFYGEEKGARFARKHLRFYFEAAGWSLEPLSSFNQLETSPKQLAWLAQGMEAA